MSDRTRLSRSRQDYLKALHALAPGGESVPTSRLAAQLAVSPPSVTHMLGCLAAERLVFHAPRAGARLTARGHREALNIVRRHRILETFLVRVLGLDWSEVHADAEVLEHHISERVLEAIDRLVGHPHEDPHGHPIPDRRGHMRRRALTPLAALAPGARAVVREIRDADGRRMARWKAAGLVPGAAVRVRAVRSLEDVYELSVAGRRLVTGSEGLAGVMVEVGKAPRRRSASASASIIALLAGGLFCGAAGRTGATPANAPAPIADNSFLIEEAYNQEARVVQHIGTWMRSRDGGAWDLTFTQEWPVGGQRHQLSYTVPFRRLTESAGADRGIGDVGLNYRFQWLGIGGGPVAFALRLTALLASGDMNRGLGAGAPGLQINLPLSMSWSPRWVAHTNAGATWIRADDGIQLTGIGSGITPATRGVNLGQSLIWLPTPTINLLLELAWDRSEAPGVPGNDDREQGLWLAPGVRWAHDFQGGLQIVPGLAVPIGLGPSRGERSLFLYLSVEHGY